MKKKLFIFLFLFLCLFSAFSQEKNILISGKVQDSISIIKNVNIMNLKTNQGTSTNDNGEFRMFVNLGDSIQFSSIQHIPKIIAIHKNNVKNKVINITLKSNTYQLDTFELKRHDLSGRLGIDAKNVPKDKKDSILRDVLDFSKIDFKESSFFDKIDIQKSLLDKPQNEIDPGFGVKKSFTIPYGNSKKLWTLRGILAQKKAFPYKVLNELGEQFFFDELKIPVDKYFHFLEYCNPLGIENLLKENKLLELIKILRKESVAYLKLIKIE